MLFANSLNLSSLSNIIDSLIFLSNDDEIFTASVSSILISSSDQNKDNIKLDCMENVANVTTGLVVEDITIGNGTEIKSGDKVKMHYLGKLSTGEKFDSSYDRNEPFTTKIGVGEVIKGWDEGVPGMKVGGKRKLTIPPALGYGERGIGPIPGNATLVFEIEAVDIIK